ncbi:HTH domain-containing protein [Mesorhizobium sp. M7A.F.Ca.US.006.01.1.1]|uniref:helix-turn-helix transcriptional regulator n=1 Tax=Mesorhizobium sp. M7A.F.Ca.US.006.01.1.1 TaxID=2496707 RepID=UPI00268B9AB9
MAAELEVSPRTVYRDIAALMAQRVPIQGEAGFGYLLADEYDMPPLMLTPAEIEAIVLGTQWVAMRGDPQLSPAAYDVLAKIVTAVPAHLRPFVAEPSTAGEAASRCVGRASGYCNDPGCNPETDEGAPNLPRRGGQADGTHGLASCAWLFRH